MVDFVVEVSCLFGGIEPFEGISFNIVELGCWYLVSLTFQLNIMQYCAHSFLFYFHPFDFWVPSFQFLCKWNVLLLQFFDDRLVQFVVTFNWWAGEWKCSSVWAFLSWRLFFVAGVIFNGGIGPVVTLNWWGSFVDPAFCSQSRVLLLDNFLHHFDAVDAKIEFLQFAAHFLLVISEYAIWEQDKAALLLSCASSSLLVSLIALLSLQQKQLHSQLIHVSEGLLAFISFSCQLTLQSFFLLIQEDNFLPQCLRIVLREK